MQELPLVQLVARFQKLHCNLHVSSYVLRFPHCLVHNSQTLLKRHVVKHVEISHSNASMEVSNIWQYNQIILHNTYTTHSSGQMAS